MSEVEQTCRICRGEATIAQPLMHPCKCRGSIKYIHQDCLLEWLNHSNNKEKRCDICNTPYQFKTIYDPAMPSRMPNSEIYNKLVSMARRSLVKNASFALYTICILQLSVYWKFVGRLLTYIVDEKLSSPDLSVLHVLLYGAYVNRTRGGYLLESPEATILDKAETFLINTFVRGSLQVIIFVFAVVVIFIEHEWVIREEGYKALLLRQIGRRPRTKLADLLALIAQNENGQNTNEMMAARALEDLRHVQDTHVHENALRAAIAHRQFDALLPDAFNAPRNPLPDIDLHTDHTYDRGENRATTPDAQIEPEDDFRDDLHDLDREVFDVVADEPPREADDVSDNDSIEERHRQMLEEELADADAAENGNVWEVLGFRLDITTPIQLMVFADTVILIFLFFAYLVPHTLGNFVLLILITLAIGVNHVFLKPLLTLPVLNLLPELLNNLQRKIQVPVYLDLIVREVLILPVEHLLQKRGSATPNVSGRLISLSAGYFIICFAFMQYMAVLISGPKPVMGRPRKVYEFMFQITATAKVFMIFASEIVLFPLYCGWLLDFCIAPLVNKDIVSTVQDQMTLHLLTEPLQLFGPYTRLGVYWALGTSYMFCVALFVSMIRRSILRSGVLYFIKSPEDPNARLIHDAIVKPFFLQILRIFLSAKVYTAFVVLGIGSVTWGLRFLVNPPFSDGALLPIQIPSLFGAVFVLFTSWVLISVKHLIAKHVQLFWQHSFAVLSHKFRLSHFLLDKPVPQERGYIVYRSFFHKLFNLGVPDYSKPVSLFEAQKLFESDPNATACFIPDGTYVRAPSSDDNSRKFLRLLFVPVTKSDQLINPVEPRVENEESDWWDEDVLYEDNYTIVYTPPHNKIRCLALVCMVILFGALLIVLAFIAAALIGRPIVSAYVIVSTQFFPKPKFLESFGPTEWKFLDMNSLCAGFLTLAQFLFFIDHRPDPTEMRNFVVNQRRRAAPFVGEYAATVGKFLVQIIELNMYHFILAAVHFRNIPAIEEYVNGFISFRYSLEAGMEFSGLGVFMHLLFSPFTIMPPIITFFVRQPRGTETWLQFIFKRISPQTFGDFGFVAIHELFLFVTRKQNIPVDPSTIIYSRVGVLAAIAITHSIMSAFHFLRGISEQIKNEKYVRGTAIQNVDVSDD